MPSDTKIIITEDNSPVHWHLDLYRIDCTQCGVVEKGWYQDTIGRANIHNKYAHNNQAEIIVPEKLTTGSNDEQDPIPQQH